MGPVMDAPNLSGSVAVPGIGKMPKSTIAIIGAGAAGVVVWAWWSRRSSDPAEPEPGEYYADLRTGSAGKDGGYVNPGSIDTSDDGADDGDRAPRTNQEWAARVLDKLSWYEPSYVSRVISAYLARQEVTQEESGVIREAWAQVGRPPEGDVPIRIKGTPATPVPPPPGGGTKPPGAKPPVPRLPAPHLHHVPRTSTSLRLQWYGVKGAKSYIAYCNGGGGKKQVTVSGSATSYTFGGLKPRTTYSVSVATVNAAGVRSATTSNVLTVKTAG